MGQKQNDPEATHYFSFVILLVVLVSCALVYTFVSAVLKPSDASSFSEGFSELESLTLVEKGGGVGVKGESGGGCCRRTENLELWGAAVKWGSEFKFSSSEECCKARLAAPNLVRIELDLSPKLVKKMYGDDGGSYFAWSPWELPMLYEGNIGKLILLE
ncbi:hypothetical protein TB1_007745 [Malus domestica]